MKGLVLAGGRGTRLRPLTYSRAKQLIPVANRPILDYVIEDLAAAGIQDIGMVVGDTAQEVQSALGDGSRFGVHLTYVYQEQPLGLAHAVKIARDFLGSDPFLMYLGDNLLQGGITDFVREFQRRQPDALILLTRVPNPQEYGVAVLVNHQVVKLVEKPREPPSDLALVGIYLFNAEVHQVIDTLQPSARGELEITEAIQGLVDRGRTVRPCLVQGWWKDTGRAEDVLDANRLVLSKLQQGRVAGLVDETSALLGHVVIEEGAQVTRSEIRGPAIIGKRARIIDSYVGPYTAIGEDVLVQRTEIEFSVVLGGTRLCDLPARLDRCLVGRDVEITGTNHLARGRTCQIVVGDSSRVRI
ncbi:MAG: glucose-1-phosphate thymidylyltransferase [Deinococcus sp.]|nr:glucose-1-phosphate thymidylyltransferase [Deinococcus sp.]